MSHPITITLPDDLYQELTHLAQANQRKVPEFVREELIKTIRSQILTNQNVDQPEGSFHPDRAAMEKEGQAFLRLHPSLKREYLGEYVAIYQEKLVDHDPDLIELIQRREQRYPDEVVLIRQVLVEPEQELVIRSPRLIPTP